MLLTIGAWWGKPMGIAGEEGERVVDGVGFLRRVNAGERPEMPETVVVVGGGKWNKIEHRLFCHITQNWRGKPLRTFETTVDLIGNTRTDAGLRVKAELDKRKYPTGERVTKAQMDALSLHRNEFPGDWNYELRPR